jgi:S1-C subfamily serine protease
MRTTLALLCVLILTAACVGEGVKPSLSEAYDGLIPGTIGLVVTNSGSGVVIVAVRPGSAAARADVRTGDRITLCNGAPVTDEREFERRVLDSRPGSVLELEVTRGTESRRVLLPVEEILTAVQA